MTCNQHDSALRAVRYAQHVTQLCAAFRVYLAVDPNMQPHDAEALVPTIPLEGRYVGGICVVPVIDEATYATAMHEIGHVLHPSGNLRAQCTREMRETGRPTELRDVLLELESEQAAWEWAQQYALEWTGTMEYVKGLSLESYRRHARRYGIKC